MDLRSASHRKATEFIGPAVSVLWIAVAVAFIYASPNMTKYMNYKVYDKKMAFRAPAEADDRIVHVDVDDKALQEKVSKDGKEVPKYGLWPWDRALSAKIIRRLDEMGARAIVFDVLYTNTGRSEEGDSEFFNAIKESKAVVSATGLGRCSARASEGLEIDADEETERRGDALYDRSWKVRTPKWTEMLKVVRLAQGSMPLTLIIKDSAGLGHIKGIPDPDGVYRSAPLLIKLEDRCVPSLALAAIKVYFGLTDKNFKLIQDGCLEIQNRNKVMRIPVDARTSMLVDWAGGWNRFPNYSVIDVLSDKPDPARQARYKGKIVVVGVTFTGTTDMGVTPGGEPAPLSRIHSCAISQILTEDFIERIPASPYIIITAVLVALLFVAMSLKFNLKIGILIFLGISAAVVAGAVFLLVKWSCDVEIVEFFLIFAPAAAISLVGRTIAVELQASRVSHALARYLSPELLATIVDSGGEPDLTTKRNELSVLFVDIEGFSTISETAAVEYINQFLNDFFEGMSRAIFENRGTIDKFLGDGLMAFFGDPAPLENHAEAAVLASIQMQRAMAQINSKWLNSGIPELERGLRIRIGINTGVVVVGNVGSSRRMEYTVLGSTVNVASRLQSLAPPGGLMMTARTRKLVTRDLGFEGPEKVRVKGIDRDIEVYIIRPERIW